MLGEGQEGEVIPVFSGKVHNRQLDIKGDKWPAWLDSLDEHWVEVIVRRPRLKRSLAADRYYRGVLLPIAVDATGTPSGEMHEQFKADYVEQYGIKSMADFDWKEPWMQREFIELVIARLAWLGREAPPPTKVWV